MKGPSDSDLDGMLIEQAMEALNVTVDNFSVQEALVRISLQAVPASRDQGGNGVMMAPAVGGWGCQEPKSKHQNPHSNRWLPKLLQLHHNCGLANPDGETFFTKLNLWEAYYRVRIKEGDE